MNDNIDLRGALRILAHRWRTIALILALVVGGAVALTLTQTKRYDATATLLTGKDKGIGDIDSILAINQTAQSLGALATDRVVIARAMRDADIDGPIDPVLRSVKAEVPANTPVIRLTVRDDDPVVAARLATSVARNFSELINDRAGAGSSLNAFVWQEAAVPRSPATPNLPRTLLIAATLGLLLATGIAFLREHLDGRWRSEADIERSLGMPVIATIPVVPRSRRGARARTTFA